MFKKREMSDSNDINEKTVVISQILGTDVYHVGSGLARISRLSVVGNISKQNFKILSKT